MTIQRGIFIVSLDFELAWGGTGRHRGKGGDCRLIGTRAVVPQILSLFDAYGIHATWATVGLLMFDTYRDMIALLPERKPLYDDEKLSPYPLLENIGADEREDPVHYALSLVRLIASYPHQEIASHTFSHYYCLAKGQDGAAFRSDLEASIAAARAVHLALTSIVFPRNQVNTAYLSVCRELGISAYRGIVPHWIYHPQSGGSGAWAKRILRFLDCYIGVTSHNCYSLCDVGSVHPYNLKASGFLRPLSPGLKMFERLRRRRIVTSLTHAAREGLVYHLWWHPENFARDRERNIDFLREIVDYFSLLRERYGMESLNMREAAERRDLSCGYAALAGGR